MKWLSRSLSVLVLAGFSVGSSYAEEGCGDCDPSACDPVFVQNDRRDLEGLKKARLAKKRARLQQIARQAKETKARNSR